MKTFLFILCVFVVAASAKQPKKEEDIRDEENSSRGGYANVVADPCERKHCGPGKECDLSEEGDPVCVCIHKCGVESDTRAKVCSTQNITFESECELFRQKCLCHRHQAGCADPRNRHAHLDYYGECQEILECKDYELTEFPHRMRQWLFLVMEELANRRDLSGEAMKLAQKAKENPKQWVIPVIWKFCDLDTSMDRLVSMSELLPITAPLKPLEHCTGPFLENCDEDRSGDITLEEWGKCLGLEEDDIEDICDAVRQ